MNEAKWKETYNEMISWSDEEVVVYGNEDCMDLVKEKIPKEEWKKAKTDFVKMKLTEDNCKQILCEEMFPKKKEEIGEKLDLLLGNFFRELMEGCLEEEGQMLLDYWIRVKEWLGEPIAEEELIKITNDKEKLEQELIKATKKASIKVFDSEKVKEVIKEADKNEIRPIQNNFYASAMAVSVYVNEDRLRKTPKLLIRISAAIEVFKNLLENMNEEELENQFVQLGFFILFLTGAVILNFGLLYAGMEMASVIFGEEVQTVGMLEFLKFVFTELKLAIPISAGAISIAVGTVIAWVKEGIFDKDYVKSKIEEQEQKKLQKEDSGEVLLEEKDNYYVSYS